MTAVGQRAQEKLKQALREDERAELARLRAKIVAEEEAIRPVRNEASASHKRLQDMPARIQAADEHVKATRARLDAAAGNSGGELARAQEAVNTARDALHKTGMSEESLKTLQEEAASLEAKAFQIREKAALYLLAKRTVAAAEQQERDAHRKVESFATERSRLDRLLSDAVAAQMKLVSELTAEQAWYDDYMRREQNLRTMKLAEVNHRARF